MQTFSVCPFCGSNQVMEANDENTIAPGGVVPFQISDKEALESFHKWIYKRWFWSKLAKDSAKPKHFKGIYLPYWIFDTDTFTSYKGEYGIDYARKDRNGNTRIETTWHRTSGTHNEFINDELVLASSNHDMSILHNKYLLLLIWVLNFKYSDKVYQFMVNGQTGKVAGKTPISIPKVIITVVGIIVIIAILYYLGVFN